MKNLLYDCEIIKCIPPSNPTDRVPDLEYCQGWRDFSNMGISCVGFCEWEDGEEPSYSVIVCDTPGFDWEVLQFELNEDIDRVIGFNSKGFDDSLLKANGVDLQTTYDILEECRIAAGFTADYTSVPKDYSYSLDKITSANGYKKTGHGAKAPEMWQRGQHQDVLDYCLNDVKISYEILMLGLKGQLRDPNKGELLQLRSLYQGWDKV